MTTTRVSPRIVWARLYGDRGRHEESAAMQLASALGAYTTWMSFQKIPG